MLAMLSQNYHYKANIKTHLDRYNEIMSYAKWYKRRNPRSTGCNRRSLDIKINSSNSSNSSNSNNSGAEGSEGNEAVENNK